MKNTFTTLLLLTSLLTSAQSDQRIGDWKSYLPYKFGPSVTQSADAVYYGTQWALLKINKEDLSMEYFSKVEGLHDVGVKSVDYNEAENVLVVVYQNSNIDLVFEDEIVNLNQILANTQIVEDRTVHDVYFQSPFAYLACGFGLVQLNLSEREFGFTTFTSTPVRGVASDEDQLIITTDQGVYQASTNGNNNLADFSKWKRLGFNDGFPEEHRGTGIAALEDQVLIGINEQLYRKTPQGMVLLHQENGFEFLFATAGEEGTLTGWACITDCSYKQILFRKDGQKESTSSCSNKMSDAIVDQQGRVWYADDGRGYKYSAGFKGPCEFLTPKRPPTHNASQLTTYDGNLFVATGGVTINYGYLFRNEGFYTNENNAWTTYNVNTVDVLRDRDMRDFLCVEAAPDGTIYFGTFWDGLVTYKDGEVHVFDKDNSSLQNSIVNPDRNRITDLAFDKEGNLWILNHDAPEPLSVYTNDGQWMSFELPANNADHIAIDEQGFKWISMKGVGLVAYDSGDDILSAADDNYLLFNSSNSELTSNTINDIAGDKEGGVWVGSSEGPVFFSCSQNLENCISDRIRVVQNGVVGILLADENIKAVAIDGGNRKWFGSNNGIFVQGAASDVQIHRFNERNSPLFDNGIIDIHIDQNSGEVYIATNKGIQSYRGEATEGGFFHKSDLTVFPNPVRPGYDGLIAINGLAQDAYVKITDVNGLLVYETVAEGGQATWTGDDQLGNRVASGVYLVFSATTPTFGKSESAVAKIMVVN